jgi:enterochelin esterase-like enzyme
MTLENETAHKNTNSICLTDSFDIQSEYLDREVKIEVYWPKKMDNKEPMSLLFVNDGQDFQKMPFINIFHKLLVEDALIPLMVIGIHCSPERRLEYGTADVLDFMNRGSRAKYHRKFLMLELIPHIMRQYGLKKVNEISYAGFSLGGLSALDVAWKYPNIFTKVGVFSGSFWWRLRELNDGYQEERDRIMHNLIREGSYHPGLKFFFQTGNLDEKMDRNNNGIIDSIDDTLSLVDELVEKGYSREKDIKYFEMPDGRHDVPTWARAFPVFLKWGWGRIASKNEKVAKT